MRKFVKRIIESINAEPEKWVPTEGLDGFYDFRPEGGLTISVSASGNVFVETVRYRSETMDLGMWETVRISWAVSRRLKPLGARAATARRFAADRTLMKAFGADRSS